MINLPTKPCRFRQAFVIFDKCFVANSRVLKLDNTHDDTPHSCPRVLLRNDKKIVYTHRQGQLTGTICQGSSKEHSFYPDLSGLPHLVKFYELWRTIPACGMKNTLSLPSTSRDALSWENVYHGLITLQENLLTVIRPNSCARDTDFPQLRSKYWNRNRVRIV
jgi:hypothetical protein